MSSVLYRNTCLRNSDCVFRPFCVTCALLVFFSASAPQPGLREVAERAGVSLGTAVRAQRLDEPAYAATLAREFNMVEPEDALKWEVLRPDPNTFDFTASDRIVAFANAHGMKVRGHTLAWHRQLPEWVPDADFSPRQLRQILEQHIRTVVGHCRGRIFAWDVINEAFDEPVKPTLRSTLWYDTPGIGAGNGTAYIEECFRWGT